MSPDPKVVSIGPRTIAVKWSSRAAYRVDTLKPRPTLQQARDGGSDGFAFLIAHLWAMLADDRERRRYQTPEDLAADVDTERADLAALWRLVFLDVFSVDLDKPEDMPKKADGDAPAGDGAANPSTGTASSHSPSSVSG